MDYTAFFKGFEKRAAEGPFKPWLDEEAEAEQKSQANKNKRLKVDPRELSEWRGPDVYYRYWP